MKYRFVWFDLGMTLVKPTVAELYRQVLCHFERDFKQEEIERAIYLTDKEFMRRYPHVLGTDPACFMPWYLGVLNYHLGIQLDLIDNFLAFLRTREELRLAWHLIPGASQLLKRLRELGYGVGLISNWDNTCRKVLSENGIDTLLDVTVISSEVNVWKPDPGIFKTALEKADVSANESLYVGDNYYDDVLGAEKAGMKCLLIAPYGRLGIEEIDYSYVIRGLEEVLDFIE